MEHTLALLVGLVPALCFGLMGCASQLAGGSVANKLLGLVLPTLPLALAISLVHPPAWSEELVLAAAINGISWCLSETLLLRSFDLLGVSRTIPITTGLQLLGASVVGVLFLGEWQAPGQLLLGGAALVLVVVGVLLCTSGDGRKKESPQEGARGLASLLPVLAASALSVAYASAGNLFSVDATSMLLPQSLFMVATALVVGRLISRREPAGSERALFGGKTRLNLMGGVLCAAGNACLLLSNQLNGLMVGWTLMQMNVIVSTVGGLFLLHEAKTKRQMAFLVAGMALVAVGGVLIGMTKA